MGERIGEDTIWTARGVPSERMRVLRDEGNGYLLVEREASSCPDIVLHRPMRLTEGQLRAAFDFDPAATIIALPLEGAPDG